IFRIGGEEFAVLLPHLAGADALSVAERLRAAVGEIPFTVPLRVSIGLASSPDDATDRDGLLERADGALYAAKGAGKDRTPLAGVYALQGAVDADALALYHHPLIGFDALEPAFLADLEARALAQGGDFLHLPFDRRVNVLIAGLDFDNPSRVVWEAAAAVPFT